MDDLAARKAKLLERRAKLSDAQRIALEAHLESNSAVRG
jgi:hypothetical protein